jgi:hypothetical protein
MLAHPEIYEDAQIQSAKPIGPQAPIPAGVHDIELSWDRRKGYMRVIIEGQKYWFKEFLGKAQVLNCDSKRGRLNLRAIAQIDGETLTMWRDPNAPPHKEVDGVRREKTHNRLCYRRATEEWRLRDERMGNHPDALIFTKSYVGDLNAEWHVNDSIAHIYHNGFAIIDKDDVAHLYDTEL